ncbi:SitI3 family protein [Micromonospora sp. HM5-17]|uniref:SitI3 family protein n=1 Tax=Micromonospora sp. HM5-17 TaxID=2487710 RepID=UPI000F47656E|nr:SitI3 family protein [Micromonospora sp. HM5-17]ROT26858.1 hypothetical protein EF879_24575 [Micromonospora sp. HM5-17]
MAIEYELTLASDAPLREIAAVVAPAAGEVTTLSQDERLFTADLHDRYGYGVSVFGGRDGYCEAEADDGSRWEWEPNPYVDITFRLSKDRPTDKVTQNMVAAVARVLASRPEDAALVLNGNWLLLTRMGGVLRKHRRTWWETYGVQDLV